MAINAANTHEMHGLISTYIGFGKLLEEGYSDKYYNNLKEIEKQLRIMVSKSRKKKYELV